MNTLVWQKQESIVGIRLEIISIRPIVDDQAPQCNVVQAEK